MDRFELEGVTYYQQRRRCGKAACSTCQDGPGHGPYWYERNKETGRVKYIGRELPSEITKARKYHDLLLPAIIAERRRLLGLADALARLIRNAPLSVEDRAIAAKCGFAAALVPGNSQDSSVPAHPLLTTKSWRRLRALIRKRDKATCQYCGRQAPDGQVDHKIPLAKGGTDEPDNLVWACATCNSSKGVKEPAGWV